MRFESLEQLKKAPRVARYFPSLSEVAGPNTDVFMFTEDVRAANFSVAVQASPDHETHAIAILKSLTDRPESILHRVDSLLGASVEKIARELVFHGRSVHEIVRHEENNGVCLLYSFTPQRLFRAFGRYIQCIPKADRSLWKKAYVVIPDKDIWDIAMPEKLGGCRGYRAMLKGLARFPHVSPSFFLDELTNNQRPAHYDTQRYVRESEFFQAKVTARWGWNRRDYGQQNRTEFYFFYRTLQFMWAQAFMREHIVREVNRLFCRLGIEAEIVIKGLPTSNEIFAVRQRMCEGDISFNEALDACSI